MDHDTKEIRNINMHFMVSAKEREMIERRMAQSGIRSLRAYMLKMAVDGHVLQLDLSGVREMLPLLRNIANNLNQLTRRVNATGHLYAADINDLRERFDRLWEQSDTMLRKLAAL